MNIVGACILVALLAVVLAAQRRTALLGMMAGVLYLTQTQQLQMLGFNLYAIRFLELAGFVRVMARREFSFAMLNHLDRAFVLLYSYTTIVFLIRSNVDQAYVIGSAVDAILCYCTFRGLVSDSEDFSSFLRSFAVLLAPYAALVLIEALTARLPFGILGAEDVGWSRDGRPRCIGSFRNPTLLGTLGSSFLPLYIALSVARGRREIALAGAVLCLFLVWASNAGGSIACLGVAIVGWALWVLRARMGLLRWGAVTGMIALTLAMKAPVWYILARVSSVTGGDGYHRSRLLDLTFQSIGKWWLAGMPASETTDWFPYALPSGETDLCCTIVNFGLNAGLGALILFFILLTRNFGSLGAAMGRERSLSKVPTEREYMLWGLGVMLSVHVFNWLGITYFDQTKVYCFMQLATISSLAGRCSGILD